MDLKHHVVPMRDTDEHPASLRRWIAVLVSVAALTPWLGAAQVTGSTQPVAPRPQRVNHGSVARVLEFLSPFGIQNFSTHYVDAVTTFVVAEESYRLGDYAHAKRVLDELWLRHPTGSPDWAALPSQPFGINFGSPPCYYGLRMLSDMTDWRVASGVTGSAAARTARLTVLLVGETTGLEPRTVAELQAGTGIPAVHTLAPAVEARPFAVVCESLRLFRDYVFAMTEGGLDVAVEVVPLPGVSLPVHAQVLPGGGYYAGLVDAGDVWDSVPAQVKEETDWWWILYPSHVPEQYAPFTNTEFITGGMGTGEDGASPLFIIDDRWLVRKPPHIGTGVYTHLERRAYLPQWLQHEFFHHLFRTWPEFGLEATSHQWFDPSTWPPDFVGRYEADYYHEALTKRLQSATPSLKAGLRYATPSATYSQLTVADLLGTYQREPIENPWHVGDIRFVAGGQLVWRNTAAVQWNLYPSLATGALLTGPDCPYYTLPLGQQFRVVLKRDACGDLTTEVDGFGFNGELYRRQ